MLISLILALLQTWTDFEQLLSHFFSMLYSSEESNTKILKLFELYQLVIIF